MTQQKTLISSGLPEDSVVILANVLPAKNKHEMDSS